MELPTLRLVLTAGAILAIGSCGSPSEPSNLDLHAVPGPREVQVGSPIELSARVVDDADDPVSGRSIQWELLSGGGQLSALSTSTGADGVASVVWTVGELATEARLRARTGSKTVLFIISVRPGDPASVEVRPLSGAIPALGGTLELTATARDEFGNAILTDADDFEWSSSAQEVAMVTDVGVAIAQGDGATIVTARISGVEGSSLIQVGEVDPSVVVFASSALEQAVRSALNKPQGLLFANDFLGLTSLSAQGKNISNLTGLENAIDLTSLDLSENRITNLEPVGALTELLDLDLSNNLIVDIDPLADLFQLLDLDVSGNDIRDIDALEFFNELRTIDLEDNKILRISGLLNNQGIGFGTTINLRQNPLPIEVVCGDIPLLIERDIEVRYSGICA